MSLTSTADITLSGIAPGDVRSEYQRRDISSWSDRQLAAAAGAVISEPKADPANSFVLHTPLELLARAGLLDHVEPAAKELARERIAWLAATYEAAGPPVEPPGPVATGSVDETAAALLAAIAASDLDAVDRFAAHLGTHATAGDLRRLLAEAIAPSLAAAAHSSIFLYLLPRVAVAADVPLTMLRGPARELARYPSLRISWFDEPDLPTTGAAFARLADALLDVPVLGIPGSDFIFPIMNQAETSGVAVASLSVAIEQPIDVIAARRTIARVAALSMLQEPADHAPYGWTHCLTMPQAVMGLAGEGVAPRTALAVAGTYVVGFRAALGGCRLDADARPERPETADLAEAIAEGPQSAAATVFHAPESELGDISTALATRASLHHDAHVVKYTLACLHAAADDPAERRLYLAAAASLVAIWARLPDDGFFS